MSPVEDMFDTKALEVLKEEIEFFEEHKSEFVKEHLGKVLLIKKKKVIGVFEAEKQAYEAGVKKFGRDPFLIKRVTKKEQRNSIPAFTFSLIHVHN